MGNTESRTIEQISAENNDLRMRLTCCICLENEVNRLFIPCCHLVCCRFCARALDNCPTCRCRITGLVTVYV